MYEEATTPTQVATRTALIRTQRKKAKSHYRRNRSGHKGRKQYEVSLLYLLPKHFEVADGVLFRVLDVENLKLEVLFIGGLACE